MIRKLLVAVLAAVVATAMTGQLALAGAPPKVQGATAAAAIEAATPLVAAATPDAATPEAAAAAAPLSPTDPTKIPHYFGPYPNWANSPQALPDAIVTISGGGGTGAEATATVAPKTGAVTSIIITSPGS